MRLNLRLSPSLQQKLKGKLETELAGKTIYACLEEGKSIYPELNKILYKQQALNPQILLFHNNTLIKEKDFSIAVNDGDVLDIIPAIEAG